jgi:hypothetical protein
LRNTVLVDIRDSNIDFHGGKGTLKVVLCDIGFSYGKFHLVKELRIPKPVLHEILSQVIIDGRTWAQSLHLVPYHCHFNPTLFGLVPGQELLQ